MNTNQMDNIKKFYTITEVMNVLSIHFIDSIPKFV